jgi:uncharacterized protein with PhoU and TrkA domain
MRVLLPALAELIGRTFGEVLLRFEDAVPCGVKMAARNDHISINPPDSYVLQEGDELSASNCRG